MQRRSFLSLSAISGAAAVIGSTAANARAAGDAAPACASSGATIALPAPAKPAQLNLCHQWNNIPARDINGKLDFLEQNGYAAVELPTGRQLLDMASKLQDALKGRKLFVATACGPSDFSYAEKAKRDAEVEKFLPQLEVLGALKSAGLILCPARRSVAIAGGFPALREDFVKNTGKRLAEHAAKNGTAIVLEPLRRQETDFLRQVADGAAIARDIGEGAKVMGDFWHMATEETSCLGAFISAGKWLAHVHIASLGNRRIPGSEPKRDNYINGFRGLKVIGYTGAVSFEGGGSNRDFSKRAQQFADMCKYLRDQWAKA
ncbi:MAG: sugar phosphate isomerase/epimerase [Puniceicoccales bacterium]|jgi:sugar phosphate isomerase/epimerase|nr:sugar phosphate isomerase/epimerase [Puniceicoccales bacterium]